MPDADPDVGLTLAFALLFLVALAANACIFGRNRRSGHRFLFSALLAGFCAARALALALRYAWAMDRRNVRLGIAAQVFTAAGVLVLFMSNLVFAQRVVRSYHPFFGWSKRVTGLFAGLLASAVVVLVLVVTVTVVGFFVSPASGAGGQRTLAAVRGVQLFCGVYLAIYAFLPVPLVTLAVVAPRKTWVDHFGEGRTHTKFALLSFGSIMLTVGAMFRAIIGFFPRPASQPAWYHSRACFYIFNFLLELLVVAAYTLLRFDKRFYIPDGCTAPGQYSAIAAGTMPDVLISNCVAEKARRGKKRRMAEGNQPEGTESLPTELPIEMVDREATEPSTGQPVGPSATPPSPEETEAAQSGQDGPVTPSVAGSSGSLSGRQSGGDGPVETVAEDWIAEALVSTPRLVVSFACHGSSVPYSGWTCVLTVKLNRQTCSRRARKAGRPRKPREARRVRRSRGVRRARRVRKLRGARGANRPRRTRRARRGSRLRLRVGFLSCVSLKGGF